jgi:phosphoribosylamine--glycine ligase
MKWADLIFLTDNARYITALQRYRSEGYPIFGPCSLTADWELDRTLGQKTLADAGITCIPSYSFTSYDKAVEFVRANPARYVSKPTGDADKSLSYVAKSPEDLIFMLQRWKTLLPSGSPFILQEFVAGIEVAVGGWMGRDGFLSHFLENFEFKKLMNGEVGPNTGEMGTVMKYVTAPESAMVQKLLLPLESELIRLGYTGYIDISAIADKYGNLHPLEFTTRPGWPLFQIQQALHLNGCCEWMLDALQGKDTFRPSTKIALGVIITIPDFPYNRLSREELSGYPIWGVATGNRFNFHPSELKRGSGDTSDLFVSAGNYLCTLSGTGSTVEDAAAAAYRNLKSLTIPNSPLYRTDIGERLEEQLPKLQAAGLAEAWAYGEGVEDAGDGD